MKNLCPELFFFEILHLQEKVKILTYRNSRLFATDVGFFKFSSNYVQSNWLYGSEQKLSNARNLKSLKTFNFLC